MPALNDRRKGIPLSVDFLANKIAKEQGIPKKNDIELFKSNKISGINVFS